MKASKHTIFYINSPYRHPVAAKCLSLQRKYKHTEMKLFNQLIIVILIVIGIQRICRR